MDSTKDSRMNFPWALKLSQTVSIPSAKRDPHRLADPNEVLLQMTALRRAEVSVRPILT